MLIRDMYRRIKSISGCSLPSVFGNLYKIMTTSNTNTGKEKLSADEDYYENVRISGKLPVDIGTDYNFKRKIVWKNAIGFLALHIAGLYGIYLTFYAHTLTILWGVFVTLLGGEGITIGAHRLYSHKSFKATYPLRLGLIICQTIAGQNCLYIWARDHRQHHKFSDTDADPHNASRGFFFSHIGWLMSKKHPAVIKKGKTIDMSDLEADPLVMFQKEHYKKLYIIFSIILPVVVPIYFWNESFINALFICYMFRTIVLLNITWCVNSVAHIFGTKPFDKSMLPVESAFVSFIGFGEGWHNYHHTFPWDYRAAELGSKFCVTSYLIDLFCYLGLAYDLKYTPYNIIQKRAVRTGDGSHEVFGSKVVRRGVVEKVNEAGDEKKFKIEENVVGIRKLIPNVNQRASAVQG